MPEVGSLTPLRALLFCVLLFALSAGRAAASAPPEPAGVQFIENRGQWPATVRFRADVPGGTVFLTAAGLVYNWLSQNDLARAHQAADQAHGATNHAPERHAAVVRGHAVFVDFVGARATAPGGENPALARHNYFLGADPAHWAAGVRLYGAVHYRELYPGIGLRFYGDAQGQLKYDVLVAPGAAARRLRWRYRGADHARLDAATGALHLGTSVGEIQEKAPLAYQTDPRTGQRQAVACRYVQAADGTFHYALPAGYDVARPLVIDPSVVACTYSGSTSTVYGYCATTDAAGNLYTGGRSLNPGFPVTPGAYQTAYRGLGDMALSKFNPAGTALLWATYLGGTNLDEPIALRATAGGELWVLGDTGSGDFPTTPGCFDASYNGLLYDAALSRLGANGTQLLASTYLGGSGTEHAADFVLNPAGTACYVALTTSSANFPTTTGSFQPGLAGREDAAVLCLNGGLTALTWSTLLGGAGSETVRGIGLNRLAEPVVVGYTGGAAFPTTPGTLGPAADFNSDGFVARLRADGTGLVAAARLGVPGADDRLDFVALDPATDDVLVYGATEGMLTATAGALSVSAPAGGLRPTRVFVSKLSADLRSLRFTALVPPATQPLTSGFNEQLTAFGLDDCGNINGAALTRYEGLPLVQPLSGAAGALYVFTLNPTGTALLFGSYYGPTNALNTLGAPHAHGPVHRFDGQGRLAQAICDPYDVKPFSATPCAYAPTSRVPVTALRFDLVGLVLETGQAGAAPPRAALSAPDTLCFSAALLPDNRSTGTRRFRWDFGDGTAPDTVRQPSHRYAAPGRYRVRLQALGGQAGCRGLTPDDTASAVVAVQPSLPPRTLPVLQLLCDGQAVLDAGFGAGVRYRWSTGINTPRLTVRAAGLYTVTLSNGGCVRSDTVRVQPAPVLRLAGPADTTLCAPAQLELRPLAGTRLPPGSTYRWNTGAATPALLVSASGTYTLTILTPGNCRLTAAQRVTVQDNGLPPNIITPGNGDALNATFVVPGLLPNTRVSFYSRWGRLVYRTDDYRNEWDGAGLASGVYYYLIENPRLCQGPRLKGWVEVVR